MSHWIFLSLLLVFGSAVAADVTGGKPAPPSPATVDPSEAMLYGQNYVFGLDAPGGWVLDNKNGSPQGLDAVFYPKGSSWAASDPIVYPQIWQKDGLTFADVLEGDVANYRRHSPALEVEDRPGVKTGVGATARLRYFRGSKDGPFEAVAYFDESKVVVMIVLSAKSKATFESAQPAFRELLESYKFIGTFERLPETDEKRSHETPMVEREAK